jgi:hypothetical protein
LKFIEVFHAYGRRLTHNIIIQLKEKSLQDVVKKYIEYDLNATQQSVLRKINSFSRGDVELILVSCFFTIGVTDFNSSRHVS